VTGPWPTLVAVGAVTFLYRFSCFGRVADRKVDPRWSRALRFVPPAAFAALVSPELLGGGAVRGFLNPRLLAGGVAALVAWKTRNVLLTIAGGMAALHLIQRLW
jgi:branched chain amino acid efflux pump